MFWKGDDELLLETLDEETENRKLISYNIGTGKFRYLTFRHGSSRDHDQGYDSGFSVCNVLPYVKSLVSVKGGKDLGLADGRLLSKHLEVLILINFNYILHVFCYSLCATLRGLI